MTLHDIISKLQTDGYKHCHINRWEPKSIIVPGYGEIELAHGEAKIFDENYAWPGYGNHQCFQNIDDLFDDIHSTWPLEQKCESSEISLPELNVSSKPRHVVEIAIKDDCLVIVTGNQNDPNKSFK